MKIHKLLMLQLALLWLTAPLLNAAESTPAPQPNVLFRNPWQLEDAANHSPYFPAKFMSFSEALAQAGIACGAADKTWAPGEAKLADRSPRNFVLRGNGVVTDREPGAALSSFLKTRSPGQPFFYWFGSRYPHRGYKYDSGIGAGKKTTDIDRVPAYWPDHDVVRRDMLDYAIEVEACDAQVGSLLAALEASGETKNTLIIVTSDHGMPFPRVKGHTYDDAHRIPFVVNWPGRIAQPGRRVADFISFIDLAPTFLEVFGVNGATQGMAPITGRSFTDLLRRQAKADRGFVLLGRERNDVLARPGSPAGLGYPTRAIREGDLFYVRNFASERWPCGNPELELKDTDASPSKTFVAARGEQDPFWQHAFGRRPAEQLFDLSRDPDCVTNLVADPAFAAKATVLRDNRWYFIRYRDGSEEFYDMEGDPMQWTNLATSKDPEISSQKARLAALFPASFAPSIANAKKDKGDKEGKTETLDLTIKPQRAAAQLK